MTAENLARLGMSPGKRGAEEDVASRLSAAFSEESDMEDSTQNALIVRLNRMDLDKAAINGIFGLKKDLDSAV